MTNAVFGNSWAARLTLVCAIACLYAGAVDINNSLLFPWLEYDDFRYLLFLPAGLKLFLIMLFGWRAVAGIAIGIAAVSLGEITGLNWFQGFALGASAAMSTQLTLSVFSRMMGLAYPWQRLTWVSLCTLACAVGCIDALSVQLTMYGIGLDDTNNFLAEVFKGAFGRVVGTFIFLTFALDIRRRLQAEPSA